MKRSFFLFSFSAAAALLAAATVILTSAAQAPQRPVDAADSPSPQRPAYPAPANLKVLPRDLSGQQVHDIMERWESALGAQCDSCHAEDRVNIGPNGRPLLDFAADSKPMKRVARTMFVMTEEINIKYVATIDSSGVPVTCGTCHRGHLGPEPFVYLPCAGQRTPQDPPPTVEK